MNIILCILDSLLILAGLVILWGHASCRHTQNGKPFSPLFD